jgi:hypothetical protein
MSHLAVVSERFPDSLDEAADERTMEVERTPA